MIYEKSLAILLACVILSGLTSCKSEPDIDATQQDTEAIENTETETTEEITEEITEETTEKKVEECNHSWQDATCTKGMLCSLCGVVKSDPIGHNYTFATCTSPAKCVICGDTKGSSLGHQYSAGYCIRCNVKDSKYVAYGTLKGTITYKYNDYVGRQGDAGATVMAIPCGDNDNTAKYDNRSACKGFTGEYESGIVVTECDGNGNYVIDNLPAGEYVLLIISQETTDEYAFKDKDYFTAIIKACYQELFSSKDLETLIITIGLNKYEYDYIEILEGRTHTVSHDFGVTYF